MHHWIYRFGCILLLLCCVYSEEVNICDNGNMDLICEVTKVHNLDLEKNNTYTFTGKGSILFKCVNSTCGKIICTKSNCSIQIYINGSITMENNTLIETASLIIHSYSIFVKDTAVITVSSHGLLYGPGKGDSVIGASYGGTGGRDVEEMFCYASSEEEIIGNPFDESQSFLYGSGTGQRGGGRIWLTSEQIHVLGKIQADGESGDYTGAGASGGTIIMQAPSISIGQDAEISAIGGMGNPVLFNTSSTRRSWKYGGGGGGRIFLRYERLDCSYYDAIIAFGGPSNGGTRGLIGGAGTITHIITYENQTNMYITIDNRDLKSTAGTPLSLFGFTSITGVTIQRTAVVFALPLTISTPSFPNPLNKGMNMKNSKLLPLSEDQGLLIKSPDITLLSNTVLSAKKLIVLTCNVFKSIQSTIKFEGQFVLNGKDDIHIDGTVIDEYTSSDSLIQIETAGAIDILGSMSAQFIHIISNNTVTVEGSIKSQHSDCITTDVFHGSYQEFLTNRTSFANATQHYIYIIAPTVNLEMKSKIEGGTIFICTQTASLNGILSSDGAGCPSGRGVSPGHASAHAYGCAGGGGYGGQGGQGGGTQGGQGGPACGNISYPLLMGSGGGSVSQSGGNGGGVILINAESLTILNKAELIADGAAASSETSGGGSGGSIFIVSQYLAFHGYAHADGGVGGENGGGGGGGGRIMFMLNSTLIEEGLFTGNYSAKGGKQGTTIQPMVMTDYDGKDGTVWTSLAPCEKGHGTVFCISCPPGYYKKLTGISDCLPCTNGPAHSYYTNKEYIDENCPYQCLSGYRGHDCLTPFYELLRQLGGPVVLILALTVFIIIILVLILLLSHYNSNFLPSIHYPLELRLQQYKQLELSLPSAWYAQDIDRMRQKQKTDSHYLTNATLIQHVGRIYLNGTNTFSSPWNVPKRPPEQLIPLIYIPDYESFRNDLNTQLRYSTFWNVLCIILLCFCFPPAALFYYRSLRKHKAKLFENYIAKGNHSFLKGPRAQALLESMKCGYDDHLTVAYIDILYCENAPPPDGIVVGSPSLPLLLPISGDGSVLHPFTLDISDVLVSSVPNCKDLLKFIDREYFLFLSQLNRYLRSVTLNPIHNREDLTELRDSMKEIMNLFHVNNSHYQYLLSAGIQLDLVVAWPNWYSSSSSSTTPGSSYLSLLIRHYQVTPTEHTPKRREYQSLKSRNSKRNLLEYPRRRESNLYSSISDTHTIEKSSIREAALAKRENEVSLDFTSRKADSSFFDVLTPARLVVITLPFADDQVQVSKSFPSLCYRFFISKPIAPSSMNARLLIKYALILMSLLDIFLVFNMNINLWCSDLHHDSTCSPIAVVVSYLLFPLSLILAPLSGLISALVHVYDGVTFSFFHHFLSIFPTLAMFFFVPLTPFIGKAILSIVSLLVVKIIERRLLLAFIAILETKEKIETKKKDERELRRTLSTSDLGIKRVSSSSSMGKLIIPRYNEISDFDV